MTNVHQASMHVNIDGNVVSISVRLITPEYAEHLLSRNPNNRVVRKRYVLGLAKALESGRFQFNGATVIVSDMGHLLDGQHRLEAVSVSRISAHMVVIEGIPESAMTTIDQGTPRRSADILRWLDPDNDKNANVRVAVARSVMLLQRSELRHSREAVAKFAKSDPDRIGWAAELGTALAGVARHTSFRTIQVGSRAGGKSAITGAGVGVLAYYLHSKGADRYFVETFLRAVVENRADPITPSLIQAVRRRWVGESPMNNQVNAVTELIVNIDVATGAFNDWMAGEDRSRLVRPKKSAPTEWDEIRLPATRGIRVSDYSTMEEVTAE